MDKFFERFKPGAADKNKKKGNNKNPLASLRLPGTQSSFHGEGQSLGGSQPGKVIPVELKEPGILGLKIEKRPNSRGTAIVAMVVENSQAEKAGLQRGDILCFAGSNGTEEIMHDMFLELAASDQRPLCFEVRRVQTKSTSAATKNSSAEAFARKQAMIAAAEKREKAHKAKTKPVPKKDLPPMLSTAEKRRLEQERIERAAAAAGSEPKSDASKQAALAAKNHEAATAAELGYNPYETNKVTAGQARTATVAMTHGTIQSDKDDDNKKKNIPPVLPPTEPVKEEDDSLPVSAEFERAFESIVTSNDHAAVVSSFGIMRKLIVNATTKGQNQDDEVSAAKFRRVRLANTKIKAAIVDVEGALDLMLSAGFQLAEEDCESWLVFPPACGGPNWLPEALKQMEGYEKS